MKKIATSFYLFAAVLLMGCGRTTNVKWWLMDYRLHDGGYVAIDTLSNDTIRLKVGDILLGEIQNVDVDYFDWTDSDFYKYLLGNHRDLFKKEIGVYRDDSTTYEYQSVPYYINTKVERDAIIHSVYVAHELYDKEWVTLAVGELSGQEVFAVTQKERRAWNYKNNISATVRLFYGASWWGTPCYQLKVEINNISPISWDKSFEIEIEGYDENHHLVGKESMTVSDFAMAGETISKTSFITNFANKILYSEYFRLYIDGVYFGEFKN